MIVVQTDACSLWAGQSGEKSLNTSYKKITECARVCYSTHCTPASFTQAAPSIREQTNPPKAPALGGMEESKTGAHSTSAGF